MKLSTIHSHYKTAQWLLFAIACLLYANTIPNKWAIDDSIIIHQNKFVQKGIQGIPDIVSKDAFSGFYGENMNAVAGGRYRPVSQVIFAVNADFFATQTESTAINVLNKKPTIKKNLSENTWFPNILHFFNMLWYGVLCMAIYRTLLLLFTKDTEENSPKANWVAFTTTLLFTIHPLHTEVVANVKGLDEILALLGAVFALYSISKSYYSDNKSSKTKWMLMATLSFSLALFSKESAVTFIAIIPLSLYVFTRASIPSIIRLSLPLVVPMVLFLGIRQAVLHQPNKQEIAKDLMNDPFLIINPNAKLEPFHSNEKLKKLVSVDENTLQKMPKSNEIATNFYTYSKYLKLLIAPYPLTVDYYPRHIEVKSFASPMVVFSIVAHLFLLFWTLRHIRNRNWLAFGILYYFITFSIVSNLFFPIGTNMAERFMFMPSLGFCLILATLLYNLAERWNTNDVTSGFNRIGFLVAFISIIFTVLTINRNFDWKDNKTLLSKDILVSQNSAKINFDLASIQIEESLRLLDDKNKKVATFSPEEKDVAISELDGTRRDLLEKSIPMLEKSLSINPMSTYAWLKLGNAYQFLGQIQSNETVDNKNYLEKSKSAYQIVADFKGTKTKEIVKDFQATLLVDYGKLLGQKLGAIDAAISTLEEAKLLNPKLSEAYFMLGTAYSIKGDLAKTIFNTKKAYELDPKNLETKQNLAVAYQIAGFKDESKKQLLPLTEKLLLEVLQERKQRGFSPNSTLQTLDLLYKNALIRSDVKKQQTYQIEILKINPNAFSYNP